MRPISLTLASDGRVAIRRYGMGAVSAANYSDAVSGASYDFEERAHFVTEAKFLGVYERLRASGLPLSVDGAVMRLLGGLEREASSFVGAAEARLERIDEILSTDGHRLYPYQRDGVRWLAPRSGALLADDMGTGKTISTLAALPAAAPLLVVCPAVVKGVWAREAERWRPDLMPSVLAGRTSFRWPERGEMLTLNYDILPTAEQLAKAGPPPVGCVGVGDEAHALKTYGSKRTEKFRAMASAMRERDGKTFLLTGTPLLNEPIDLWCVLSAANLEREAFTNWSTFVRLFKGHKRVLNDGTPIGWVFGMPDEEVPERLSRVMLRRMKRDVLPQLPVKTWRELTVDCKPGVLKECDAAVRALKARGMDVADVDAALLRTTLEFEEFSRTRAALAAAKIPAMLQLVKEFETHAEPLLVFSAYRAPIDVLAGRPGWKLITGDTSGRERTQIEEAFQRGELKGVASTIRAGGVGITLTRACNAVFVDREPGPTVNEQAEDRLVRIGQTRGVVITTLVVAHVLDRRLAEICTNKQALIDATLDMRKQLHLKEVGDGR